MTTIPITLSVGSSRALIYLPVLIGDSSFTGTSRLYINSVNTGGVSLIEVRSIPENELVLICGINNNTTGLCGSVPDGQYTIIVTTLNCGQINTVAAITSVAHTVTADCSGSGSLLPSTITNQVYIETN